MIIVLMGVSGSGKSTIGQALAEALHWRFIEGDAFHSAANRARMAAGVPLGDEDRWPWLDALGVELAAVQAQDVSAVVACSALRRVYRDRLRQHVPDLRVVCLYGEAERIAQRLATRSHEYMPASLLASQLDLLELPDAQEAALVIDTALPPADIVDAILAHWTLRPAPA